MNQDQERSSRPLRDEHVSMHLQRFVDSRETFEAVVDDLVRVRVGSSLSVVAVEILDPTLEGDRKSALEVACVGAINAALQKAAIAAGQALAEITQNVKVPRIGGPRAP